MFSILFITRRRKYSEWPCVSILVLVDVPFCCIKIELYKTHTMKLINSLFQKNHDIDQGLLPNIICIDAFVWLNYYVINLFHWKIFFFCFHELNTISRKKSLNTKQTKQPRTYKYENQNMLSIYPSSTHPSIHLSIHFFVLRFYYQKKMSYTILIVLYTKWFFFKLIIVL